MKILSSTVNSIVEFAFLDPTTSWLVSAKAGGSPRKTMEENIRISVEAGMSIFEASYFVLTCGASSISTKIATITLAASVIAGPTKPISFAASKLSTAFSQDFCGVNAGCERLVAASSAG